MERENCTTVAEFILEGFTVRLVLKIILFIVFLLSYVITMMGNIGFVVLVSIES